MNKLDIVKSRIFSWEGIQKQCNVWHYLGQKIVFTNGCFDILHLGHIEYLAKAAEYGKVLIIGLNSDSSVRKIKGETRPINDEKSRSMVLASLRFLDAVVLFDQETPYELIQLIKPDILVKGQDYTPEEIVGYDIVSANGGKVITIELTNGYSTTSVEDRILALHKK
ncbi:MAG: D-glycero-beta-D-manno-heptose 1-phosphate adenylyltransferase [Bacteroidetes bacterium]|nr:D-glycero-beta-D-manno-heptose 1-phosphate adenylyltransferase [Bacteroidota bacterium]